MTITDMILTLVRLGLLLGIVYGTLAAAGYLFAMLVAWLHDMFDVVWQSKSGPFVVTGLLVIGGVWLLWTVLTTKVAAFWKWFL